MKIYRVEWYLAREQQFIIRYYANKHEAYERFEMLKNGLHRGSWVSLDEIVDNCDGHGFFESDQLEFVEI